MRNMSFFYTTEQILNRTKTVTRRLGWKTIRIGEIVRAVKKCQGLKKGEKIEPLAMIQITNRTYENLINIIGRPDECRKEGFPDMATGDFVEMFCNHMKCDPYCEITRLEFEYVELP